MAFPSPWRDLSKNLWLHSYELRRENHKYAQSLANIILTTLLGRVRFADSGALTVIKVILQQALLLKISTWTATKSVQGYSYMATRAQLLGEKNLSLGDGAE